MQGDRQVITHLNLILANELTAINQYFLHARMLNNWGLNALGNYVYQESIGEMKHADLLINRILFLEGHPNLQELHKLKIGENVPEIYAADLSVESKNRTDLQTAMQYAESVRDYETKRILNQILSDTEAHIDWIETQQQLINQLGLPNYLQSQMGSTAAA